MNVDDRKAVEAALRCIRASEIHIKEKRQADAGTMAARAAIILRNALRGKGMDAVAMFPEPRRVMTGGVMEVQP